MFMPGPFQMALEFSQIIVWKDAQVCAAQFCTVDQRRVAEFVEQNHVVPGDKRWDRAERGGVSAAEAKCSASAFPFRERPFQTQVWRLRPADQPRSACADAEFVHRGDRRLAQSRIVPKAKVIVRGKVQETTACNFDLRPLSASEFTKMSIERSRAECFQLLCEQILHHRRLNCGANQLRITK